MTVDFRRMGPPELSREPFEGRISPVRHPAAPPAAGGGMADGPDGPAARPPSGVPGVPGMAGNADPLTAQVRAGLPSVRGWAGVRRGLDKLTGAVPLGADAPTLGLRKAIGGAQALLSLVKSVVFLLFAGAMGLLLAWVGLAQRSGWMGAVAVVALLGAAWFARWTVQDWRALRSILRA